MNGDGITLLVNLSFVLAVGVAFVVIRATLLRARGRQMRELASPLLVSEYVRPPSQLTGISAN